MRVRAVTIRARVTALAALAVTAVLLLGSAGLVVAQRQLLLAGLDAALAEQAAALADRLDAGEAPAEVARVAEGDDTAIQLTTPDGRVISGTAGAEDVPLAGAVGAPAVRTVPVPVDDDPFRVRSSPILLDGEPAVLHVGVEADAVGEAGAALTTTLLIAVPLTVAVLSALVWVLVGRTLRPVAAIQAEVAAITASALDRRVPEPPADDEIGRLARLLNGMLDRLDDAATRQRRFTGDAAHELRTPLARLRTELEVDLAHPGTADPLATHRSALEEVTAMQALVEGLLLLARADDPAATLRRRPVVVADVLREAVGSRGDGVGVRVSADPGLVVDAHAASLTRAVRNLVDNAVRHATSGVDVTSRQVGDAVEIAVADDGPGIPLDQREAVFDRFTRLDDARASADGGSGLGLAITREVVSAHGGTVEVDPTAGAGTRVRITLPPSP